MDAGTLSQEVLERARSASDNGNWSDTAGAGLSDVRPAELEGDDARIAFWINVYNALVRDELARHPRSGHLLRHRRVFRDASYEIGGERYTPDVIEHGLLRLNSRPPLGLRPPLRPGDPRFEAAPSRLDPRIHFALNCAAASCPPIRSYWEEELDSQLELATRSYVIAETKIDREQGTVRLPYLLKLYARDFGGKEAHLDFVIRYLPAADAAWLVEGDGFRGGVTYAGFDWTITSDLPPV